MNKTYIYSHNPKSQGAAALALAMGIPRIKYHNSKFVGGPDKQVINWGCSQFVQPFWYNARIFNHPWRAEKAINKLWAFGCMEDAGVSVPPFTTDKEEVRKRIHEGEGKVRFLARTIINGSGGRGIKVVDNFLDIPEAPLYVQYIKKQKEFRVHVVNGKVIDVQQKVLRANADRNAVNWMVRNIANSFVFKRNGIVPPVELCNLAISAVAALQLDFGAVDIIYNAKLDKCFVLECNTAPGLEGLTIQRYKDALNEMCNL
jgi:glutathione synthase/RimK-type ligase-like ATP-grasp enzyme